MSADNWTHCPACKVKTNAERAAKEKKVKASYGKVPADEYLSSLEALKDQSEPEETLREDWDIGLNESGEFSVDYSCQCSNCNFKYRYNHKEQVV